MSQLGFTFYPKDWWTSDTFFTLNPFERYIYLELLFMMYDNEGCIKNDRVMVERRLGTTIKDNVWSRITDLMVKDGDHLTHKSVNKRLSRAIASRLNGRKGGRPPKMEEKPTKPKNETYKNPPFKIESKIESKKEKENSSTSTEVLERVHFNAERPLSEVFKEMDENNLWKEQMCMKHSIPGSTIEIKLKNFDKLLSNFYTFLMIDKQITNKSLSDTYSHFSNWLPKQLNANG